MNSFVAVAVMVAAACMSGYFIPTLAEGEMCFVCAEADLATCGTLPAAGAAACVSKICYEVHVQDAAKAYAGTVRGCLADAASLKCEGALKADSTFTFIEGGCKQCPATAADICNKEMHTALDAPAGNGAGAGTGAGTGAGNGTGNGTAPVSGHPPSFTAGTAVFCAFMSSLAVARMMFYDTAAL